MVCPQCTVPIQGKSLTRNSSYSTMVQCIVKIRKLIDGTPNSTQSNNNHNHNHNLDDRNENAEVLISVLDGLINEDENKSIEHNENEIKISENQKVVKKVKTESNTLKDLDFKNKKIKQKQISSSSSMKKEIVNNKKSPKRIGLLLTGLSEDQKATIQSNLQKISKMANNVPVKIVKDFLIGHVTHIICACAPRAHCPRTLKYLLGIAGKAWIVSFDWILESLEGKSETLAEEENFIVTGDEAVQCDTNACEKSRADPGRLFDNQTFYLAGLFNAPGPSKSDLTNLIQLAGGEISKRPDLANFLVSNNSNGPKDGEKPYTWLFDSISFYEIK